MVLSELTDGCVHLKIIGRLCISTSVEKAQYFEYLMRHINVGLALNPNIRSLGPDPVHAEHRDSGDGGDPEGQETVVHEHGDSLHGPAQSQGNNELIFVSE